MQVSKAKPEASAKRPPVLRDVPAVSRAIAILRVLGRSDVPMGVQAIATTLGIVPSTCLHILRVLVAEHLVSVNAATKQYSLASGLVALARIALQKQTFAGMVQPSLDAMSKAFGVTAIGVEALGLDHMVVVALSRSDAAMRIHVDVGSRFPLFISATGRCVAAFGALPWREIEKRFRTLRWDDPPTLAEWQRQIEETRQHGYAVDDGQYIAGIAIVAAPIFMPSGAVSAIVAVGLSEQLRRVGVETVGPELAREAERLSRLLGAPS